MKTLYLVRHAKSSWNDPDLSDFDRPLNKRGEGDAPEMGRRLKEKAILPDLLLSSPANRAITTARTIADEIGYDQGKIATDEAIYHAGAATLLDIIRKQANRYNSLMLFGHNPGFTDLANQLAEEYLDNISTCGILALKFTIDSWKTLEEGEVIFYDYPKKPKDEKFMS